MTTTQIPTTADYYTDPYPGRKGSDIIVETCGKCSGTGSVSWGIDVSARLHNIETGKFRDVPKVCFDCHGTGRYSFTVKSARARVRRHAKARAETERKAAEKIATRDAAKAEFVTTHPEVVEAITTLDGGFGESLRTQFEDTGKLTENQIQAVLRIANEQANDPDPAPVVEGRGIITGKILTTKWQDSDYGSTFKMLVLDDRGFKVWGTVPRDLDDTEGELRGSRVTFTGTVEQSPKDETFGFYKRPTKAELL